MLVSFGIDEEDLLIMLASFGIDEEALVVLVDWD
jgi:hypothetical protein